jgi:hypothetical protein
VVERPVVFVDAVEMDAALVVVEARVLEEDREAVPDDVDARVVGTDDVLDGREVFEVEVVDAREALDKLVDPVDTLEDDRILDD